MVRKEDVDFYGGFSRKELQSLCKRYNLPANRSSSDMAESLASYVERNSMNSVAFGDSATTSRAPTSKTWDVKRDSYGNKLDKSREDCVQGATAKEPGFILADDNTQYHQEGNGDGGLIDSASGPPYMRNLNEKGPIENTKKDTHEVVDSGESPSSSSFEFHVSLEEGINLSVDLNFNPSDWIKSMRDEVNVYDSSTRRRRKSPPSGLGNNNGTECKKQKSSGKEYVRRESSSSPVNKDNTQLPNSSGPGQIVSYCVESFSKSGCVNQVDFDCVNPPGKLTNGSVMAAGEQNHQTGDLLTETPENPSLQIQKVGNISTVTPICPLGGGSDPPCSPRKTSSYSESFKFRSNGGKNYLPPNTEEQEKSEVLSEQARSD